MKTQSFRWQIVLGSVLVSGAVLLCFGMVAWWSLNHDRLETLDDSLSAYGLKHATRVSRNADVQKLSISLVEQFGEDAAKTRFVLMLDNRGGEIFRSDETPAEFDPTEFPGGTELLNPQPVIVRPPKPNSRDIPGKIRQVKEPRFYTIEAAGNRYRIGVFPNREVTLITGANLSELSGEVDALRRAFLLALPGALFLIALGAWFIAKRALRPVHALGRDMRHVSAQELSNRLEVHHADSEFEEIIDQYNQMLERLERSFHQATRFSADASHELKTPLAIMRGTLERALVDSNDPEHQAVFSGLLEQTDRQKAILDSLLLLSRADSGHLTLSQESLNLSALLPNWLEDASFLSEERHLTLTHDLCAEARISGDPHLLQQVAHNLFSNAVRHNVDGGAIHCLVAIDGAEVVWEVTNTGPAISAREAERIFERFQRGSATQGDGTGLGLSLIKEIITAHGGSIRVYHKDERNVFRVTLPNISSP
jgi:signal transduction histidine kinase